MLITCLSPQMGLVKLPLCVLCSIPHPDAARCSKQCSAHNHAAADCSVQCCAHSAVSQCAVQPSPSLCRRWRW